jgi:Fe2+ or Zn2+ uptake regulation protein
MNLNIELELRGNGLKITPQRLKILGYFKDNPGKHFTADEVHQYVKIENPNIPPATIYNILRVFVDKKLINSFEINGKSLFEEKTDSHINFYCQLCNTISDYEFVGDLKHVESKVKGKVLSTNITVRGVCEKCLKSSQEKNIDLVH